MYTPCQREEVIITCYEVVMPRNIQILEGSCRLKQAYPFMGGKIIGPPANSIVVHAAK